MLVDDIFSAPNKEMTNFGDLIEPLANAAKEMNIELTDKQVRELKRENCRNYNFTFELKRSVDQSIASQESHDL